MSAETNQNPGGSSGSINTKIIRIPLVSDAGTLEERIENECEVLFDADFLLASSFVVSDQLVLIFQVV